MSKNSHTPGPWAWVEKDGNAFLVPLNHEDAKEYPGLCAIADDGSAQGEYGRTIEPRSSNARLIAAAPDLLEALEGLLNNEKQSSFEYWISRNSPSGDCESAHSQWLESSEYHDFLDLYNSEIAAIAKARGES